MAYALQPHQSIPLDEPLLELLIDEHERVVLPRLERFWNYYRNALAEPDHEGGSNGPPAQRCGLPPRLRDPRRSDRDDRIKREIVIENDIAWRINTLVDFMFPAAPRLVSRCPDPRRRREIESLLEAVFESSGGIALWQDAALMGSIYGHVDFLVTCHELSRPRRTSAGGGASRITQSPPGAPSKSPSADLADRAGSFISIETVEAPRAIALLHPSDYRDIDAYILHYQQPSHDLERESWLTRLARSLRRSPSLASRASTTITEIHSATHCQRYDDGLLVDERVNRLGRIPVVHVQNLSQPLQFAGLSDVEPLIPLQDELNTRLSDRANRVTMQSFRMYLGKGIEGFTDHPVGPGQMWMTDNLEASIEAFGGDADSPSERQHIEELREAMDKASGVTPAAAGHINAKVGNLTSENALRISLLGTLAKIKRKRITYGAGIQALGELVLHALDVHGLYRTVPSERGLEIAWPNPLPIDESRRIDDALKNAQLGVNPAALRAELGYPDEPSKSQRITDALTEESAKS